MSSAWLLATCATARTCRQRRWATRDPLREVLERLARMRTDARDPNALPDGRAALARTAASLASLLDRRVELVDVGASAGTRVLAGPGGSAFDGASSITFW